jgi:hypothetical protein
VAAHAPHALLQKSAQLALEIGGGIQIAAHT